jgi:uncharacterized protein YbjT (DUF2867 family)
MKRVLVIGATGMLGRPVARQLIAAGYDVTIASRNPEKVTGFDAPVVKADLFDIDSLRKVFEGQNEIYLNLSVNRRGGPDSPHQESDGLRNAIVVAKEQQSPRIALISSLVQNYQGMNGFHWWEFDVKREAIRLLRDSGLPYFIFYPSSFMENFTHEQRQGNRIMLAGKSRAKMWFIAGDDYGRMVAKAMALPPGVSGEYIVQGPEGFTYDEAAKVYVESSPEDLRVARMPLWPLRLASIFKPSMRDLVKILVALNNYPERFDSEKTWNELGRPQITLAEFAKASASPDRGV